MNNNWKTYHEFLNEPQRTRKVEQIQQNTGWSLATYYRKMKNINSLKPMEKNVIAEVYQLPFSFLF